MPVVFVRFDDSTLATGCLHVQLASGRRVGQLHGHLRGDLAVVAHTCPPPAPAATLAPPTAAPTAAAVAVAGPVGVYADITRPAAYQTVTFFASGVAPGTPAYFVSLTDPRTTHPGISQTLNFLFNPTPDAGQLQRWWRTAAGVAAG